MAVTGSHRVIAPTFEIPFHAEIPISHIRTTTPPEHLILQVRNGAFQEIRDYEQQYALEMMDEVTLRNGRTIIETPERLNNPDTLKETLLRALESLPRDSDARIFMNATEYTTMRHFHRDDLDHQRSRALLQMGFMATFRGATVMVFRAVPSGNIYLTAGPEAVGHFPIRSDITIMPVNDPRAQNLGWLIYENIGMCCMDPMSLLKIQGTR
jgi:hypothetical protein